LSPTGSGRDTPGMPTVAVVGGSLGGLTTALVLRDIGCDVTVHERSSSTLEARGVGIAVLPETLRYPLERLRVEESTICSSTDWIRFVGGDGDVVHEQKHRYRFSSWNTIYSTLRKGLDDSRYLLGHEMVSFDCDEQEVSIRFGDGTHDTVDLLVCADGINSSSREGMAPEAAPRYAGYVAWRGTVPEAELTSRSRSALADALTYQLLPQSHILVYPIPGPDGAVEVGQRLMNMVWYRNVDAGELPGLLTDRTGVVRTASLPPGAARDEVISEMRDFASTHLAPAIAEVVAGVREPFLQTVMDIAVPRMVSGRACLVGDAAFAVRPHAAAGTAKAAEDGWVLAEELANAGGDVPVALARWQDRQLRLGSALLQRTREIGDTSQFSSGLRPGDPRLIFGLHGPGC